MTLEGVSLRAVRNEDLPAIVSHYGSGGVTCPWDPFADLERIRRLPREGFIVATVRDRYAGFLYWYEGRNPWYDRSVDRCAMISDLHLLPEYRGHGLGRALLDAAVRELRARGIPVVFLETDEGNEPARRLYESVGFSSFSKVVRYRRGLPRPEGETGERTSG